MKVPLNDQLTNRLIGAHVSAAGGIENAVERASAIGANCVQVFSGSPRVWQRPDFAKIDVKKITSKMSELSVSPMFIHALYLVNLASENSELVHKSATAITFDLRVDALLGGAGVVVHLGSHQGRGWEVVREQVAEQVAKILHETPAESHFLIENAAGQKGKIGSPLSEIRWLLNQVKSPRLGWCLDTCHAWASGYRLAQPKDVEHIPVSQVGKVNKLEEAKLFADPHTRLLLPEIEKLNLWDSLRCIHINDSRDPFASGRDRHANLKEGTVPVGELRSFLAVPQLLQKNLPLILEVPGEDKKGPNVANIEKLKELVH